MAELNQERLGVAEGEFERPPTTTSAQKHVCASCFAQSSGRFCTSCGQPRLVPPSATPPNHVAHFEDLLRSCTTEAGLAEMSNKINTLLGPEGAARGELPWPPAQDVKDRLNSTFVETRERLRYATSMQPVFLRSPSAEVSETFDVNRLDARRLIDGGIVAGSLPTTAAPLPSLPSTPTTPTHVAVGYNAAGAGNRALAHDGGGAARPYTRATSSTFLPPVATPTYSVNRSTSAAYSNAGEDGDSLLPLEEERTPGADVGTTCCCYRYCDYWTCLRSNRNTPTEMLKTSSQFGLLKTALEEMPPGSAQIQKIKAVIGSQPESVSRDLFQTWWREPANEKEYKANAGPCCRNQTAGEHKFFVTCFAWLSGCFTCLLVVGMTLCIMQNQAWNEPDSNGIAGKNWTPCDANMGPDDPEYFTKECYRKRGNGYAFRNFSVNAAIFAIAPFELIAMYYTLAYCFRRCFCKGQLAQQADHKCFFFCRCPKYVPEYVPLDGSSTTGAQNALSMTLVGCTEKTPTELVKAIPLLRELYEDRRSASVQVEMEKEAALKKAEEIIQVDMLKYSALYADFLNSGENVVQRDNYDAFCKSVHEAAGSAKKQLYGEGDILNPPMPSTNVKPDFGYIAAIFRLYEQHGFAAGGFQRNAHGQTVYGPTDLRLQQIANETGAEFGSKGAGPRKKPARIADKAKTYKGRYNRITDIHRRSLVCKSFAMMQDVIGEIALRFLIVRLKNRFEKSNKTAKDSGGYRDTQLLVCVPNTQLLLEVQVHLKEFHDAKVTVAGTELGGKTGHQRYIEFRTMKEGVDEMGFLTF